MRIGLNLLFLIPEEVGGTETYARGLLNALAQVDVVNEYIVFINRESQHLDFVHHPNFTAVNCKLDASNRPARFVWEQCILPWQIRRAKVDVIHSLGYVGPLFVSCKSVVTVHDLNYIFVPQSMTRLTRSVQKFFVGACTRHADHIIVVSEFIRGQVIQFLRISPKQITTIYEAAEHAAVPAVQPDGALLAQYGLQRPYILAFSSLTPHKNIRALIQAFQRLNQRAPDAYQLVIVGHQPRTNPSMKEMAIELGLKDSIVFTGYLERRLVDALLGGASVFAFPSLYEGFGLPLLEAMASGTPVVCSRGGALQEIAGNSAVYFEPTDVAQMAEVLLQVLQDEPGRRALILRGEKNAGRFSWEETARRTLAVYTSLVQTRPHDRQA
jgi:glycosyltransferase involved in cell wall biosynthesis